MEKSNKFVEELYVEPKKEEILVSFLQLFSLFYKLHQALSYQARKNIEKKKSAKYIRLFEAFSSWNQSKKRSRKIKRLP